MNPATKLALMIAGAAIAVPQSAAMAKAPNAKLWSGNWQLNADQSKFSSADSTAKSDTRTYQVSGNRVTMRSSMTNAAGKTMKWSYSAATDGKWYPVSGNPNADHIALRLVGDREIKSETQLKGKPSANSLATVSADGKQLTIARHIMTGKGAPTNDTLVYDRTK
jgi:hypothetical protein